MKKQFTYMKFEFEWNIYILVKGELDNKVSIHKNFTDKTLGVWLKD